VLNANVDTLLKISVADRLVENNANGGLCNVVDDAGLSVVELVRHTLLDCTVTNNIDNVTDTVLLEVDGERNYSSLLEVFGEGITGTCSKTS